jgi:cytoskeletal protein CcmA (bactofilin family)
LRLRHLLARRFRKEKFVFKFLKPDEETSMASPQPAPLQPSVTPPTGTRSATNPVAGSAPAPKPAATDNGIDVPPFRPATQPEATQGGAFGRASTPLTKEQPMARSIFGAAPPSTGPAAPTPTPTPTVSPTPTAPRPPQQALSRIARDTTQEKRTLVVGRGISVQGSVQDAERLVVEGTVEASMIHAAELMVAQGGIFRGEIEVEDAEIAGTVDGTLTVKGNLIVRTTGVLLGTARCRRLQVEDGGQITGRIEMITETKPRAATAAIAG